MKTNLKMKFFYLILLNILIHSISQNGFCQTIFYQDICHCGVTGGGFSTGLGSGSGDIQINIQPNSSIKKAYLLIQRFGNAINTSITFENHEYPINHLNQVSDNVIFPNTPKLSAIHAIDITNDISPSQSNYNVIIPPQMDNPAGVSYGNVYLFVVYKNPLLNKTAFSILLNNKNMNQELTSYHIQNLNPIDVNFPVGFSLYTDRLKSPTNSNDGSYLIINGNNVGLTGGGTIGIDEPWDSGSRGHFYYHNNQLFGLNSSIPNDSVSENDGLINISNYVNNLEKNLSWKMKWQSHSTYYNIYSGFFLTHTTPCDTIASSVNPDTTICYGEPLQLQVTGGQAYEWTAISDSSSIDDLSCTDCPAPIFSGDSSATYTVRVWNSDSCSVVRPIRINVSHPQKLNSYSGESKCGFSNGYIKSINLPDNLDAWYVVTQNNDTLDQHIGNTYTNLGNGDYSVFYIDTIGCKSEDTIVTINSYINTIADFTLNPSTGSAPLTVQIENQSQNASGFEWFVNGVSNGATPPTLFELSGEYEISLIAWDEEEYCADTTWRKIVVYDSLIAKIPNVFTANKDGINDFFSITVNFPVQTDLMILNRWGNVVFDWQGKLEKGQNNLWNGESKNGVKVNNGVYFYRIEFSQMEWVEKERKVSGYVHVIDN